jgi:ABC-2 type transport system permease protein
MNASTWAGQDEVPDLPAILVNQDDGQYGEEVVDILDDLKDLVLTEMDSLDEAKVQVAESQVLAAILIPADFSDKIEAYEQTEITVIVDPTQTTYSSIITEIMEEVAEPIAMIGEIRYGMQAVMDDMGPRNDNSQRAADAQQDAVITTQMEEARNNPMVKVVREDLEGAEVAPPDNAFSALLPGFGVLFAFFLMPVLAGSLLTEKESGSLRRLIAAPISRGAIIAGKVITYMLVSVIQVMIVFLFANLFMDMPLGNSPLGLLLVGLALGFAATSLGMMIAAVARSRNQSQSIGVLLVFVLGALGGCFMLGLEPIFRMEGPLGFVSRLTPQAHALEAFRRLLVEGYSLVGVLPQIGILTAMGTFFFAIAVWRFRFE